MPSDVRILRADSEQRERLEQQGWTVVATSWGAQLLAERCDVHVLRQLTARAAPFGGVRPLTVDDVPGILALDASTVLDYPGAEATAHTPLTVARATVGYARRGYGVVRPGGEVLAMTLVDADLPRGRAEVDFTVVARRVRGSGLAAAVKAASILDLLDNGVTAFRTGGSDDNAAILAVNESVGFVIDEHWVTMKEVSG